MAKIFFSYSHEDESFRDQLEKHFASLKHEGLLESWHDRRLIAGSDVGAEIDARLEESDVVLLLVSAAFINSGYCYSIEMAKALERNAAGLARVMPIILRPCLWHNTELGRLLAAPKDGKAISTWPNVDEAYTDVARQLRDLIRSLPGQISADAASRPVAMRSGAAQVASTSAPTQQPRSSNMRMRKTFTEADQDRFLLDAFGFVAGYFENSLAELQTRHPDIETRFRRIDADSFSAVIYRGGQRLAECMVLLGGAWGRNSISYSHSVGRQSNAINEQLSVKWDDQEMFLSALGMVARDGSARMSVEQGAELFWQMLLAPLQ